MKLTHLFLITLTLLLPKISLAQAELVFSDNIKANFEWVTEPQVGEESILRLKFADSLGNDVGLQSDPAVILWMPDMNHGSAPTLVEPVLDQNGNVTPGVYQVSNIYFVMHGLWEVRVERTLSDETTESKSFIVDL